MFKVKNCNFKFGPRFCFGFFVPVIGGRRICVRFL